MVPYKAPLKPGHSFPSPYLPWLIPLGYKNGIVLVTPSPLQVVQNLKDESYFVAVVKKGSFRGRQLTLCQRQRSYSKKTDTYCSGKT